MTDTAEAPSAAASENAAVARHYPWVRAAAMRRVRDLHLADDVAQAVFILLMEKRPVFASEAVLAAWLFQTMRYASAHALRAQRRRAHHESRAAQEAAAAMQTSQPPAPSDAWSDIAPLLDQSVAQLRREDRQAVLLRFYQQKTFGAVGAAMGISEEAARKRVDRAVEKLRHALTRRGVAAPSPSVLATMLLTHTTPTIPVAPLIATTAAASGVAAGQIAKGIAMSWTPAKIAAVTMLVIVGVPAIATVAYLSLGSNHPRAAPLAPAATQAPVTAAVPAVPTSTAPARPVSQTDPIIPNDLLSVSITDLVGPGIETVKQCRVDPDSNITLPLVGAVGVKNMVLRQAELAVQKAYGDANLMPNARIRIARVESGTSPSMLWARIAVGDYVRIDIADLVGPGVETTIIDRIADTGQVALPQAGSIKVVGLSENELAKAIELRYRQQNLIPNAQVSVQRITEQQAKGQPRVQNLKPIRG